MSQRSVILLLATVQLVASVGVTVAAFSLSMGRFDAGTPPTSTERAIGACGQVLRFPVVTGALASGLRFPGLAGYVPFILNGLLWAVVASGLLRGFWKLGRQLVLRLASHAGGA